MEPGMNRDAIMDFQITIKNIFVQGVVSEYEKN